MKTLLQLRLLLWKNILIQRRQIVWTIAELILPVLFTAAFVVLRQSSSTKHEPPTYFESFPVKGTWEDLLVRRDNRSIVNCECFAPMVQLCCSGRRLPPTKLLFTPNTTTTNEIMSKLAERYTNHNVSDRGCDWSFGLDVRGVKSEDMLVEELISEADKVPTCENPYLGGIVFDAKLSEGKMDGELIYAIRLSNMQRNTPPTRITKANQNHHPVTKDSGWNTKASYPVFQAQGPREPDSSFGGDPGYWTEGFLSLQKAVDTVLTESVTGQNATHTSLERFPYPAYISNTFVTLNQLYLPLLLMLSFIVSVLYIARSVVEEREKRLKEYMRVMGLSNWIHWLSHFLTNFIKLLISIAVVTLLLCISIRGKKILEHSDPSLIFVFLLLYAIGTIAYAFCISVFVKRGNTAAAGAGILWFVLMLPFLVLQPKYQTLPLPVKLSASLFLNSAMGFGIQVINIFEGEGIGLHWSSLFTPGTSDDTLTMAHVFLMLLIDIGISLLLTWYVEAVMPGDEGVAQKPWFPFQASYWFPDSCGTKQGIDNEGFEEDQSCSFRHFEEDPAGIRPEIIISGLTKVFNKGKKEIKAVNRLNLRMFSGQVTALLGHNGAGKSTTVSMLTGILPPSSGKISVNGMDIATQLASVRQSLGLCPQYNVLFDNLTVREHLYLFCQLKGKKWNPREMNDLLDLLGLLKKKSTLSKSLSGGMKRKLSVAIALIGGSEVVVLDEPSAGMDPGARHEAWRLLQREKKKRTIILTTHFMEEADVLGDRIAIMARGQLQCSGSSLFLKKKYGEGQRISVIFERAALRNSQKWWTDGMGNQTMLAMNLLRALKKHCPRSELVESIGLEATYTLSNLPRERFEELFSELEYRQRDLGVSSFGISMTTMEEVFLTVLRLVEASEALDSNWELRKADGSLTSLNKSSNFSNDWDSAYSSIGTAKSISKSKFSSVSLASSGTSEAPALRNLHPARRNSGAKLFLQRFYAGLIKRGLHSVRNWLILVAQFVIPIIGMLIGLALYKTTPGPSDMPPLKLDLHKFGKTFAPVSIIGNSTLLQSYEALLSDAQLSITPKNKSMESYILQEYSKLGANSVDRKYIVGAKLNEISLRGYFNNQPYHSPAISLNLINNAILRELQTGDLMSQKIDKSYTANNERSQDNAGATTIITINHPLPPSKADTIKDLYHVGYAELMVALCLVFGIAFLSSSFVVFLIRERESRNRHLQFLTGLDSFNFWFSTFVWDYVNYILPALCILAIVVGGGVKPLVEDGRWAILLLLLALHAWAVLPLHYIFSFAFKSPVGAFVKLTIFNLFSGCATLVATGMMYVINQDGAEEIMEWIFLVIFPNFTLAQGVNIMYMNSVIKSACAPVQALCKTPKWREIQCCYKDWYTPTTLRWENPGIGRMPFFLILQGLVFWVILILIETKLFGLLSDSGDHSKKRKTQSSPEKSGIPMDMYQLHNTGHSVSQNSPPEDSDVLEEKFRLSQMSHWDGVLLVRNLTKWYKNFQAVRGIDFSVKAGECFGLLGTNGAGKTTTFRMLTGESGVSDGEAIISGTDVRNNPQKAGQMLGYCPQTDAVVEELTGRENLTLFARLRGIPEGEIPRLVDAVLDSVGVTKVGSRLVKTYSGGNRRRLSLGVALVGNPPLLLLDEPTSGVDPAARRAVWSILAKIRHQGTAIVLTSHSMEECEALCTRLGIMVSGSLKCLGSPQHLKGKFGAGYSLQIKVKDPEDVSVAVERIVKELPSSQLKEVHDTQLIYEVLKIEGVTWSFLYRTLERLVYPLNIVDYGLSQTTLEQVFLRFSRQLYNSQISDSQNASPISAWEPTRF